jgi:hypothetical protein
MDPDGIVVRFLNNSKEGNGLSKQEDVDKMFNGVNPSGCTPLGTKLRDRILNGIVRPLLNNNELQRPVLVMIVTDGQPDTSPINEKNELLNVLTEAKTMFKNSKYGEFGICFSFSQIGTDKAATEFLGMLDTHPVVGNFVDCTSSYLIEKQECGPDFTESAYLIKLMIGAIDPAYDQSDEQGHQMASSQIPQQNVFGFSNQQNVPVVQAQPFNGQSYNGQNIPVAQAQYYNGQTF